MRKLEAIDGDIEAINRAIENIKESRAARRVRIPEAEIECGRLLYENDPKAKGKLAAIENELDDLADAEEDCQRKMKYFEPRLVELRAEREASYRAAKREELIAEAKAGEIEAAQWDAGNLAVVDAHRERLGRMNFLASEARLGRGAIFTTTDFREAEAARKWKSIKGQRRPLSNIYLERSYLELFRAKVTRVLGNGDDTAAAGAPEAQDATAAI